MAPAGSSRSQTRRRISRRLGDAMACSTACEATSTCNNLVKTKMNVKRILADVRDDLKVVPCEPSSTTIRDSGFGEDARGRPERPPPALRAHVRGQLTLIVSLVATRT